MKATADSAAHSRARPSQRSSTACSRCHERKVRCDITTSSGPCSNCRVSQVECVAFKAKKRYVAIIGSRSISDGGPCDATDSKLDSGRRRKHLLPSISDVDPRVSSEHETIFYGSESQSSKIGDDGNDSQRRGLNFPLSFTIYQLSANAESVSRDIPPDTSDADARPLDPSYKLLGYVRPTPSPMAQDDLDHLARKNVFALPSESFRNSCVTSYVHWVHFFLPLLDLREFLSVLAHPDGSCGQVSLLLLYAVMLGGATFAPQSEITKAGYTSRFAARRDFFQRCKVSCDTWTSEQVRG